MKKDRETYIKIFHNKILWSIIVGIISIGFAFGGGYYYIQNTINRSVIYEGISIEGIDIGELTKAQALEKLKRYIEEYSIQRKIILYYEDENWAIPFQKWGGEYNYEQMINKAYGIGREGNILERYKMVKSLEERQCRFDLSYTYDIEKVKDLLKTMKNHFSQEPKDAIIQRIHNDFIITDEEIGTELNIEATANKIRKLLENQQEGKVQLVLDQKIPKLTRAVLEKIQDKIGSFHTSFNPNAENRAENLSVAVSKINGTLIQPDQVFSTNQALGPLTHENGYKQAPVIVNGKLVPGYGGGICQVATTLYNAVLFAELEVVERSNHSMPVGYVDLGRDATLAGNWIDFKFRNSTGYPIFLESFIENGKLYVALYGNENREKNRKIEFESVVLERMPPPIEKVTQDANLEEGNRVIDVKPLDGIKVKVYKKIYIDGTLSDRQVVNGSYYRPRAAEVRIGTKKVEDPVSQLQKRISNDERSYIYESR